MLFGKPISAKLSDLKEEVEKSDNLEAEFKKTTKSANDIFRKKFNVVYKFTYEDLKHEIMQKDSPERKYASKICDLLNNIEFDRTKLTKNNLIDICEMLKNLSDGKIMIEIEPLKEEMFAPPQMQTPQLIDLPAFSVDLNSEINSLMENLKQNKTELDNQLKLIEEEKDILKREQKLPKFKSKKKVDEELESLETKKKELEKKEEAIDEKLLEIKKIEYEIDEHAKKLSADDLALKEKEDFIISKEKLIEEIRKDFKVKYDDTLKEIEELKKDLKDKEESFLGLQKFYQKREEKLFLEENNLLEEKRRYGKTVSGLIGNHINIAKEDIEKTQAEILSLKSKIQKADESFKEYSKNQKKLMHEKDMLRKTLDGKKKYFSEIEKDFSKKDLEFQSLEKDILKRQEKAAKLEQKLHDYETHITKAEEDARKKHHELELKELDLRAIDKQIGRMQFDMKNQKLRLDTREKYLQKRLDSFEELRKDIKNQIAAEKRAVARLEEKLYNRGNKVNRRLRAAETEEENYDSIIKGVYSNADNESQYSEDDTLEEFDEPYEVAKITEEKTDETKQVVNEITVTHLPDTRIGNPSYLDILRLINIAKDSLEKSMADRAKGCYVEIIKLFDDLSEQDKDELYSMITEVFRTKGSYIRVISEKIESLLTQFNSAVERGDMVSSSHIYSMLQQKYLALPKEDKPRYYNKIMEVYNSAALAQV